jgi:hypothetical protein
VLLQNRDGLAIQHRESRPEARFQLTRNRDLGKQYGVEYAEAFHYIGGSGGGGNSRIDDYVKQYGVRLK